MGFLEFIGSKISSAIGGMLGGSSALKFMNPKDFKDAYLRGALSIVFSVVFGTPVLWWLGLPYQNWEWQLASGFVCGFLGYALMSASAKYISNSQEKDIMEILAEVSMASSIPAPKKSKRKTVKSKRKK